MGLVNKRVKGGPLSQGINLPGIGYFQEPRNNNTNPPLNFEQGDNLLGDVDLQANATRFNLPDSGEATTESFDLNLDPNGQNKINSLDEVTGKKINDLGELTGKGIKSGNNFFDNVYDSLGGAEGIIGGALDIIPLAGAAVTKRNADKLYDESVLSSKDADFRYGQVTDPFRPNMAAPATRPTSSSTAEEIAGKQFGMSQQINRENAHEQFVSDSRQKQQSEILNRENAETQFNVGRRDRVNQFNAQNKANQAGATRKKQGQFEAAALANLNTRQAENAYMKGSENAITAADVIRSGQTNDWVTAQKKAKEINSKYG